jgi:hypothetical protein
MPHFSIFGGCDVQPDREGAVYITIFAGTNLLRPPTAQLVVEQRETPEPVTEGQHYFLTIFGGAVIRWPTLTREFIALTELLRSGRLTIDDWDRYAAIADTPRGMRIHTLNLFGAFNGQEIPSENAEIDDLTLQRHLGYVSEAAAEMIMPAIGQTGGSRLTAVRQAALRQLDHQR